MKTINIIISACGVMAILGLAQSVQAQSPFIGVYQVDGKVGVNNGDPGAATSASGWEILSYSQSGTFSSLAAAEPPATWDFDSGAIPDFMAGGFSFDLIESSIASQGTGYVNVAGTGVLTAGGYSATPADITLNISESVLVPVFSLTITAVPEPGTMTLLGAGLGFMLWRGRSPRKR